MFASLTGSSCRKNTKEVFSHALAEPAVTRGTVREKKKLWARWPKNDPRQKKWNKQVNISLKKHRFVYLSTDAVQILNKCLQMSVNDLLIAKSGAMTHKVIVHHTHLCDYVFKQLSHGSIHVTMVKCVHIPYCWTATSTKFTETYQSLWTAS